MRRCLAPLLVAVLLQAAAARVAGTQDAAAAEARRRLLIRCVSAAAWRACSTCRAGSLRVLAARSVAHLKTQPHSSHGVLKLAAVPCLLQAAASRRQHMQELVPGPVSASERWALVDSGGCCQPRVSHAHAMQALHLEPGAACASWRPRPVIALVAACLAAPCLSHVTPCSAPPPF
jgi:hypothetical protein